MATFKCYEIETQGDIDAALSDLRKAGLYDIKVVGHNEDEESLTVSCNVPPTIKTRADLKAALADSEVIL